MPGPGPGIHAFAGATHRSRRMRGHARAARLAARKAWMAGTSPAMTARGADEEAMPAATSQGIHAFAGATHRVSRMRGPARAARLAARKAWMAGTSPAMTERGARAR